MEFEITHKRLYRSLLNMIEWTKQHQKRCEKTGLYYSSLARCKELATIKFALPRQSGHTTFAFKLLTEYFGVDKAVLITPFYLTLIDHEMFRDMDFTYRRMVASVDNAQRLRGTNPEAVIVDCTALISQANISKIYNNFPCAKYYIFLE